MGEHVLIQIARWRVLWGRVPRWIFRRRIQVWSGNLGSINSEFITKFWHEEMRELAGEEINVIPERQWVVEIMLPLVWCNAVRWITRYRGMTLLGLRSALVLVKLIVHHSQKVLVTLSSSLGTLVVLFIAAVPEGFNDVPEAMVCYPLSFV